MYEPEYGLNGRYVENMTTAMLLAKHGIIPPK